MEILSSEQYNRVFDEMERLYHYPDFAPREFQSPVPYKTYQIPCWTQAQERIVNEIFCGMEQPQLYALDWNHDCFLFSPAEPHGAGLDDWWYDEARDCRVYFPSYYPDGDYHAFMAKDLRWGMMGSPWKERIYVVGERLIAAFEENSGALGLRPVE